MSSFQNPLFSAIPSLKTGTHNFFDPTTPGSRRRSFFDLLMRTSSSFSHFLNPQFRALSAEKLEFKLFGNPNTATLKMAFKKSFPFGIHEITELGPDHFFDLIAEHLGHFGIDEVDLRPGINGDNTLFGRLYDASAMLVANIQGVIRRLSGLFHACILC
jgi:hypothetical protein